MINYKSIIFFLITLFFVIISSSLIADGHKDHKKREKNMSKMTKIIIKVDRIFKSDNIDFTRLIKIGNQLKTLGIEFPDYSKPDSNKGSSKSSMWTERELFLDMNQDFVDSVDGFIEAAEKNDKKDTWNKFKIAFDECQRCHHKFARAKINLLED
tara:strand:+ start:1440 stop:1904 length:465 start_codon:yes stop_codon:yes gene_type:complete